jgi:hypothetical protein
MSSTHHDVTGRKSRGRPLPPPTGPLVAYTIPEFCAAHRISQAFYYQLKAGGRGPRERRLNSRIIITAESAAEWRAQDNAAA